MRFPSKVTPYENSIISKFPLFLSEISSERITPANLFKKTVNKVSDISEFIDVLDCLFVLGKVALDDEKGELFYVD